MVRSLNNPMVDGRKRCMMGVPPGIYFAFRYSWRIESLPPVSNILCNGPVCGTTWGEVYHVCVMQPVEADLGRRSPSWECSVPRRRLTKRSDGWAGSRAAGLKDFAHCLCARSFLICAIRSCYLRSTFQASLLRFRRCRRKRRPHCHKGYPESLSATSVLE